MTDPVHIKNIVKDLPEKPGVYQFFNQSGEILYIGKAKNLRKRVSSYFIRKGDGNYKQEVMLRKIFDIRYIIVENESDALLLENNLIKEYQPKYNVLLKDDKTYPWICIKHENFPRVFKTRQFVQDGSEYFGPYTSGVMVKTLLDLIRELYPLRSCNYLLSNDNISKRKYKKCLEFHLGNCKGPCEGLQTEEEYNQSVNHIREILKGNLHQVITHLHGLMLDFSSKYLYEEAELIRIKLELLERFKSKSTIVNPKIHHVDVFSMIDGEKYAYLNFIKVVNGAIIKSHNIEIIKNTNEEKNDLLAFVIFNTRERFSSDAAEIIVPFLPNICIEGVKYTMPSKGDKLKLLELSMRNADSYRLDKELDRTKTNKSKTEQDPLIKLQKDLRLRKLPVHIECFDNSNIQGSNPVSACVVFKNGKPNKRDYRHYHIRTVKGPNDFASMAEVIERRYNRLLTEEQNLPDLVIVDGGKGQLNAAVRVFEKLAISEQVALVAIAKRLEEIFMPGDPTPLYLNKQSVSLKLIQKIRNEAHRFGIDFYRKTHIKSMLLSELDRIKGIGKVTKQRILQQGKSVTELKQMDEVKLEALFGRSAAKKLMTHFHLLQ